MINVVFLGYGNLNYHLCRAFLQTKLVSVKQIYNRNPIDARFVAKNIPFTDDLSELKEAEIYIIGIPDDAISAFSERLPFQNKLTVHTSGGVAMGQLSNKNKRGVLYPLQTFSKQRNIDFKNIPICIEAENPEDLELLRGLGKTISENVVGISSKKRARLHLAAVFVNNFTNYLYRIGSDILKEDDLPFDLLKPLIMETASKIEKLSPEEAQTGPARRNDKKTIEKHLTLLGKSEYRAFYELFTNALNTKQQF